MDTFLEDEYKAQKKNRGAWAGMNFLQRGGVILAGVFFVFSLPLHDPAGTYCGVACWTSLFLGYVAGALWKVRHAVHFWWSLSTAVLIHSSLLPAFVYLSHQIRDSHSGRGYIYAAGGLLSIEVIVVLFLLKRVAIWLHARMHRTHSERAV